jgi:hypothetical protein
MNKKHEPLLERIAYVPKRDVLALYLATGSVVEIPRANIEELRELDPVQLRELTPDNAGMTLSQRSLDIDIYLPGLLSEAIGISPGAVLGKEGGARTSEAKRLAARRNGSRGGRPKKTGESSLR